ncbi:MAG: hypothetical protein Q9221_007852 [Calogaya cf. arnoldii]
MDSVSTSMFYLKRKEIWSKEKPYFITVPPSALPKGQNVTNEESEPVHNIGVHNCRNQGFSQHQLDLSGFTFAKQDFTRFDQEAFVDYKSLRVAYVPVMQDWLKGLLGAEHITTLSVNVRRRDASFPAFTWGKSGDTQPIQGVHVDYTPRHAMERIKKELGAESFRKSLGRRMQILNVWRPLLGPLRDWPLAMLDYQSVDKASDLIAADVIYPHYVGESFNVFHNSGHRWFYLADQMPEEVLIFKSFDSMPGVAEGE